MTFDDFIKEWDGKHCEVAGSANAKNQCVDLANAYIRDVLKLPIIEWTDAKDFPSKASDAYSWVPNKGLIVPEVGDLVVWSTNHISICTYSDIVAPWFTSFDQNWPTGSVCHKVDHNYNNVSGWLRPKGDPISNIDEYSGLDLSNSETNKETAKIWADVVKYNKYVSTEKYEALEKINEELKIERDKAKSNAEGFRKEGKEFIAELAEIFDTRQEKTEIISDAKEAIGYEDKVDTLGRKLKEETANHAKATEILQLQVNDLERQLGILKEQLQALKEGKAEDIIVNNWLKELINKLKGLIWIKKL